MSKISGCTVVLLSQFSMIKVGPHMIKSFRFLALKLFLTMTMIYQKVTLDFSWISSSFSYFNNFKLTASFLNKPLGILLDSPHFFFTILVAWHFFSATYFLWMYKSYFWNQKSVAVVTHTYWWMIRIYNMKWFDCIWSKDILPL